MKPDQLVTSLMPANVGANTVLEIGLTLRSQQPTYNLPASDVRILRKECNCKDRFLFAKVVAVIDALNEQRYPKKEEKTEDETESVN